MKENCSKSGKNVFLFLAFTFYSVNVLAYDFEVNGLYYNILSNNAVEVTNSGTTGLYSGKLEIPEKVYYRDVEYRVTAIGNSAFEGCKNLVGELVIPNSVTNIGHFAFDRCEGFTGSLIIPNSVTSIGAAAFYGCSGFTGKLSIPNTITSIERYSFSQCSGFAGELAIPNSITSIGNHAFSYCYGFTGLTIPSSVTSIGYEAFYMCISLEKVRSGIENPFSISEDIFKGISSDATLQVPKGTKSSYQQFSGWIQHFKEIFEESGTDPTTYTLAIASAGNGNTTYNGTTFRGKTKSFSVNEGESATISFAPDNGYRIASVLVGNTNVTSSVYNNQYTINNITGDTNVVVYYEQMPSSDFVLNIKTNSLGKVGFIYTTNPNPGADHTEYNGTVSNEYSRSVVKGGAITLSFYPNEGCELTKLIVNSTDVTTNVVNQKYTINNINSNQTITATFEDSTDPKQRLDGHDYVDLGLPSGKLWATVNYGATQPEEYGNYVYWSSSDIISSSWGNSWITPSLADVKELINNCTWTWGNRNGVNGYTIKGNNGNTIFLPAAGVKADKVSGIGSSLNYWTSTKATGSIDYLANIIMADPSYVDWGLLNINFAQAPIRPVSKAEEQITTFSLNISVSGNGSATYNGTTARNQTRTFTVNQGTSATISFSPDNGYRIGSLLVNNTNVTSSVYNNQYTINNITANTTVSVTFEQSITSLTYDGVKYRVVSFDNKTVNMANGSYAQSITIPASFYSQGFTWTVVGIDNNALSNSPNLSAIIWNPNISFTASVSNPNLLLYVKASQYAPSAIKNVIVNNIASRITLTDAADGNDFYCPQEFTAQNISYTHTYGMTTGIDYAMGWESLALPFDVKNITHSSKGSLLPFAKWSSQANAKPFWLYELKASGFVAATDIKANTPYIISMPNNSQYDSNYNVNGTITFSSSNVVVKKSDNLNTAISGSKYFVPNFSNRASNVGFYALNVKNNYEQNNSSFRDGSIFVKNLRKIHPFEAYIWMSGNNAKEYIPIFEDETTPIWLPEIPMNEKTPEKVYNLNGQQVNSNEFRLPKGIYVIKGKKIVIK